MPTSAPPILVSQYDGATSEVSVNSSQVPRSHSAGSGTALVAYVSPCRDKAGLVGETVPLSGVAAEATVTPPSASAQARTIAVRMPGRLRGRTMCAPREGARCPGGGATAAPPHRHSCATPLPLLDAVMNRVFPPVRCRP